MNLIITDTDIKTLLRISGTAQDAQLALLNKMCTDVLYREIGQTDATLRRVADEVHDGGGDVLTLAGNNVREIEAITEDGDAYEQDDDYDIDDYRVHLEDILSGGARDVKVTYIAGWGAARWAKITIVSYSGLAGKKITYSLAGGASVDLTEGTNWNRGASNAAAATSLAAALEAVSGMHAFASGAVVYVIDDTAARETMTIVSNGGADMTVSAYQAPDVPEALRLAVCLLVAGKLATGRSVGVKSYTVGGKTVSFKDESDAAEFKRLVAPFKRGFVGAIGGTNEETTPWRRTAI